MTPASADGPRKFRLYNSPGATTVTHEGTMPARLKACDLFHDDAVREMRLGVSGYFTRVAA